MDKYYITGYIGEGAKSMLHDVYGNKNVFLIGEEIQNKIIRFLYLFAFKRKWLDNSPMLRKFFYPFYTLNSMKYKKGDSHYLIFFNSRIIHGGYYEEFLLKYKKQNPQVHMILYIVDTIKSLENRLNTNQIKKVFEQVYSINKEDCQKYHFEYYPLIYSIRKQINNNLQEEKDVYFLGSGLDREKELCNIIENGKEYHLNTRFIILNSEESKQSNNEITYTTNPIPYLDNLNYVMNSNCILELVHSGLNNPTQRFVEAIVYNRKLLTNNPKVKDFDYYNPNYIHYFENVHDIDFEWVKKQESIDYGYDNDYSPVKLLEHIKGKTNG